MRKENSGEGIIFPFLKKKFLNYIFGILILLIVDYLQILIPGYLQTLIDDIKYHNEGTEVVSGIIQIILLISLGIFVARFLWRIFIIGTSRSFERYVRNRLFSKLLSLSPSFYDKEKVGDIMARMTNDLNSTRSMLAQGVLMLADSIFLGFLSIFMMITKVDLKLTLVGIIPLPVLAFCAVFFGTKIHNKFTLVQESFSSITDSVQETLDGIRVVKSFSNEEKNKSSFSQRCEEYLGKSMKLVRIWGLFFPLIEFMASLGIALTVWYGGKLVVTGSISLGQFIAFTQYLGTLVWPMIAIGWVINIIQRGRASYKRLLWIENSQSEVVDPEKPQKADLSGDIRIQNLNFSFPESDKMSLKKINLEIRKGQTVSFVGKTGSGKSTLAKLIVKLYPVSNGKIFFDNMDINALSMKDIREQVAYVQQESFLFSATIEENIGFSSGSFSEREVQKFAEIAAVHSNIVDFPQGYKTIVGERGITLSGGQKQRIAIARALMKKTPVVILDDCLSAVDTETEAKILDSLKSEIEDRTTIIISHRLKAVSSTDRIFVFDKGVIIEEGIHKELLEKKGMYARLYEKQLIEEKLERDEV